MRAPKCGRRVADAGVIQPWPLQVAHDGKATPVLGFFRIDEAALNALDDTAFLKLRRAGALQLAYLELLSTNQIAVFERLSVMQQQLSQAHQQQRQISSLDELFANASSDTLHSTDGRSDSSHCTFARKEWWQPLSIWSMLLGR